MQDVSESSHNSWRFVWSDNTSRLTQAGGVSALFITEKPFFLLLLLFMTLEHQSLKHIYSSTLSILSCFSASVKCSSINTSPSPGYSKKKHPPKTKRQKNKIIFSNFWFRYREMPSPRWFPDSRLKRFCLLLGGFDLWYFVIPTFKCLKSWNWSLFCCFSTDNHSG